MAPELYAGADAAAAGRIRTECQWHIAPIWQEELSLRGDGSSLLLLPTLKPISVDQIIIKGLVQDLSKFVVDSSANGVWIKTGGWNCEPQSVQVRFTHGYAECPPELKAAAAQIARQDRAAGFGQVSIGQVRVAASTAGDDGLDPYVSSILKMYRLPPRT